MSRLIVAALASIAVAATTLPAHAVKKVPYPEVKVRAPAPFKGDAAFEKARKALADAVAKKDIAALSALVAPNFMLLAGGDPSDQAEKGRDGLHNFKVAFGFRARGQKADGKTEGGPQWDYLADLTSGDFTQGRSANMACGPASAVPDERAIEAASQRIESPKERLDWVYTTDEITLTARPGAGNAVGKISGVALPVAGMHPRPRQGQQQDAAPTHLELLLPSGKTGWVAIDSVSPLGGAQLCLGRQPGGDWKIVSFDQGD
jgi:hypothetical protein